MQPKKSNAPEPTIISANRDDDTKLLTVDKCQKKVNGVRMC